MGCNTSSQSGTQANVSKTLLQDPRSAYIPKEIRGVVVLVNPTESKNVWRLTNANLGSDRPDGVSYRRTKTLADRMPQTLPWEATLEGVDELDGWVRFPEPPQETAKKLVGTLYLPKKVKEVTVLVDEPNGVWRVTNENLKSETLGLGYRKSKNMADKLGPARGELLAWGAALVGTDEGDGWVRFQFPQVPPAAPAPAAQEPPAPPAPAESNEPVLDPSAIEVSVKEEPAPVEEAKPEATPAPAPWQDMCAPLAPSPEETISSSPGQVKDATNVPAVMKMKDANALSAASSTGQDSLPPRTNAGCLGMCCNEAPAAENVYVVGDSNI